MKGLLPSLPRILLSLILLSALNGCALYPLDVKYAGPRPRPLELHSYYDQGSSYTDYFEEIIGHEENYMVIRATLTSHLGDSKVDFFKQHNKSEDLILVLPILGGRNLFANYFAEYFAKQGYNTAVIHRNGAFKDPNNIDRIEEIFRANIVRDRMVLDFFENIYGIKNFGSFGISRGAINVAMLAGVDERLKYNVIAMGGEDLVGIFRDSDEKGLNKFKRRVMQKKNFSEEEFIAFLEENVVTDPENLASHIDARNTLMILSMFDQTVPIEYGMKLRRRIGKPDTIFLAAGHYTSIAYTQFVKLVPPVDPLCVFPMDYVETESLAFFNRSFERDEFELKTIPYRIIQFPFTAITRVIDSLF